MSAQEFCYWLQGYLELREEKNISEAQIQIIKDHIGLVLKKVTPQVDLPKFKSILDPLPNPLVPPGVTITC